MGNWFQADCRVPTDITWFYVRKQHFQLRIENQFFVVIGFAKFRGEKMCSDENLKLKHGNCAITRINDGQIDFHFWKTCGTRTLRSSMAIRTIEALSDWLIYYYFANSMQEWINIFSFGFVLQPWNKICLRRIPIAINVQTLQKQNIFPLKCVLDFLLHICVEVFVFVSM